jgi:hypothetical protein
MTPSWIFSIATDSGVVVVRTFSHSESFLDVTVVATGDHEYETRLTTSDLSRIKYGKNTMDNGQWEQIVRNVLLGEYSSKSPESLYSSIKVDCSFVDDLIISIKQEYTSDGVVPVTLRLGEISLRRIGNPVEIGVLFNMYSDLLGNRNRLFRRISNDTDHLKKQVDQLVQAKKIYDNDMFARFAQLLNAKKDKITQLEGGIPAFRSKQEESVTETPESVEPIRRRRADIDVDIKQESQADEIQQLVEEQHRQDDDGRTPETEDETEDE